MADQQASPSVKRRILFLSAHHGVGASEDLWCETAGYLAAGGHTVAALANWRRRSLERESALAAKGCRVAFIHSSQSSLFLRALGRFLPYNYVSEKLGALQLARFSPELTVISQGNDFAALPWMYLCRRTGRPYVIVTHGLVASEWPDDTLLESLRSAFTGALRSYWVADRNIRDFEYQVGLKLQNAERVWNPLKCIDLQPVPWPEEDETLRLASVARLQVRSKGHDLILKLLALPKWRDRPIHVSFFGKGQNEEALRRMAAMLNLDNVSFPGHVDDIAEIWRAHHLLLQPSRHEGMPVSLIESLWCGRPCVVTDVAGHAEVVEDGVNGFIASAPTVDALDAALERAWQQRTKLGDMGKAAAREIRQTLPSDPVASFAEGVLALLSSPGSR